MNYIKKSFVLAVLLSFGIAVGAQSLQFKLNNVTVKKAMSELKHKTGYSFVFEAGDVDSR